MYQATETRQKKEEMLLGPSSNLQQCFGVEEKKKKAATAQFDS